jgi:hypothetical protein
MPVYQLQPLESGLLHPAWSISWHQKPCTIVADTPAQARQFANGAFIIPMRPAVEPAQALPLPWSSVELVMAERLPDVVEFGLNGTMRIQEPRHLAGSTELLPQLLF